MDSLPKLSCLTPFRYNFYDLGPARDVPEFSRHQGLGPGCGQGAILAPRGRPRGQPPQKGDHVLAKCAKIIGCYQSKRASQNFGLFDAV